MNTDWLKPGKWQLIVVGIITLIAWITPTFQIITGYGESPHVPVFGPYPYFVWLFTAFPLILLLGLIDSFNFGSLEKFLVFFVFFIVTPVYYYIVWAIGRVIVNKIKSKF